MVQGEVSDIFQITRSIKQGGILSTFFFVAYYHDIHEFVTRGHHQALTFHQRDISSPTMADDTLLLSATVHGLQTMIDNAYLYGRLWRLEYSPTKTKCIIFTDKRNKVKHQWYLGEQNLEEVNSYNYLGVILSADGSTKTRTTNMTKKGYSSLGILKASGFHSEGLSPITCSTLWQRMLIPSMLYGCEVWGKLTKKESNSLELVQKRIGKHIQGLCRRTHDEIVRGLLGWITIAGITDKCKLNFVYKLIELPHDNIIKQIFLCQIYYIIFVPMSIDVRSLTYDLWGVMQKYNVGYMLINYLVGGCLPNKMFWKQICSVAVYESEEEKWRNGLLHKQANRFYRIHNELKPFNFIYVDKR